MGRLGTSGRCPARRGYPETDVPPVEPDPSDVDRPELLDEKAERYTEAFGLDAGLAEQVAFGQRFPCSRPRSTAASTPPSRPRHWSRRRRRSGATARPSRI